MINSAISSRFQDKNIRIIIQDESTIVGLQQNVSREFFTGNYSEDEIVQAKFLFQIYLNENKQVFCLHVMTVAESAYVEEEIFTHPNIDTCLDFANIVSNFLMYVDKHIPLKFALPELLWQLKSSNILLTPVSQRNAIKIGDDIFLSGDIENKQFTLHQESDGELIRLLSDTIEEIYEYLKSYFKLNKH